ncbi:uncharacterized protein K489DRAFT_413554 [Dissoconium aciculare CBS 342.82]|uniref:Uncharacterized protein n=1 Tax=Dissoconium aciculare CBS 342.82 TaxID=1314786 RepID=A0A6J3LSG3_9PEZI|nr:uncharacterized protein K489DRAFT_413554 [Dissoconium aciculare CBS 342.82]KAF1818740.1 hypothetical protein K489DRAFT_413554 [Dissoconium aciculare CBS 342.82]
MSEVAPTQTSAPAPEPAAAPAAAAPAGTTTAAAPAADNRDYLDKAVDAAEKKLGQSTGHNVDPAKYRSQNEKITDKLRALFEKFTGKKLPSKVSN